VAVSRISRINVTPVKSLRVHHPDAASLRFQGVVEDRRFLLVDECGRLYHGNRDPRLVCASAAWEPESRRLAITTPGEAPVEDVVIRGERSVVDVYGRSVRGHVVQGPWATALSKFVGRPLTLVERDDDQWATDIRPITIISQASLNLIDGDGRRFRMLLEFEGVDALQEETWRGRRVRAGDATLLITGPTPRCAVPSANPEVGLRDRNVLRELRAVRGDHGSGMAWLGARRRSDRTSRNSLCHQARGSTQGREHSTSAAIHAQAAGGEICAAQRRQHGLVGPRLGHSTEFSEDVPASSWEHRPA
jgi:uncharacterized protein YcbX